jgi:prepilin-type N-terminal cleavage/methylation domain-containing protein
MRRLLSNRAGFTLAEVMVALTMTAVIGAAVTGVFVTQSRFFDTQEKVAFARGVSRGGMNMMVSELRMLEQGGGLVTASSKHVRVRAPYAMGIVCGNTGVLTISRLPADPFMYAGAGFSGYAVRDKATGLYTYVTGGTVSSPSSTAANICNAAGITVVSDGGGNFDGQAVQLSGLPSPPPAIGSPVLLFQEVRYRFKPSINVPGRIALFRRVVATGVDEELVAPFDTSAGFRFYVNDGPTPQAWAPSPLTSVTGLELILDGLSDRPDRNGVMQRVPLRTSVFFKNRP